MRQSFVKTMIEESERKLIEKENAREEQSKKVFAEQMEQVRANFEQQKLELEAEMKEGLEREKKEGLERERLMKEGLEGALADMERDRVVGVCLGEVVAAVGERVEKEKTEEELRKAAEERAAIQTKLDAEMETNKKMQDRLEELSVVVNEREKMEGIEWAKILEGGAGVLGGEEEAAAGGAAATSPKPVTKTSGKAAFPAKD